tara:strand:+ start:6061 stop:6369 length:309 start_codon:yes stop_codon:yes gene_type:complete
MEEENKIFSYPGYILDEAGQFPDFIKDFDLLKPKLNQLAGTGVSDNFKWGAVTGGATTFTRSFATPYYTTTEMRKYERRRLSITKDNGEGVERGKAINNRKE